MQNGGAAHLLVRLVDVYVTACVGGEGDVTLLLGLLGSGNGGELSGVGAIGGAGNQYQAQAQAECQKQANHCFLHNVSKSFLAVFWFFKDIVAKYCAFVNSFLDFCVTLFIYNKISV